MQSNKGTVLFEREGRIGRIILNRPEVLNDDVRGGGEPVGHDVEAAAKLANPIVAALVISKDDSMRNAAEFALANAITAQGAVGLASYALVPKELVQDKDKAKAMLEKEGVVGVVTMRVVGKDKEITSSPGYWSGPGYASFWGAGYWGWGWGGVYNPGYVQENTIVSVETLIYSLPQDKLVWAAMSKTTNPSEVNSLINELVTAAAKQLKQQGLIR
jgi:hypothetical protein